MRNPHRKLVRKYYRRGDSDFHSALGRFINGYAYLELMLQKTVRRYSEVPDATIRAITGGIRTSDALGAIKRLGALNGYKFHSRSELEKMVDHINIMTKFRDLAVHRWAARSQGKFFTTNEPTYKTEQDIEIFDFTIIDLDAAAIDVMQISFQLSHPFIHLSWNPAAMGPLPPLLYKHRQPEKWAPNGQPKRQSKRRQQRA